MNAKSRPGVDCDTDHILVAVRMRMNTYRIEKRKKQSKFDIEKLKDPNIREVFQI